MTEPDLVRTGRDGDAPGELPGHVPDELPAELPEDVVSFTAMADGTAADYALLDRHERIHAVGLPDRILASLDRLRDSIGGYDHPARALAAGGDPSPPRRGRHRLDRRGARARPR